MCLVIEIKSDASLSEAVQILAQHKILSAPVVDVDAPEDASWIDRYIGIVEFAGIVFWLLCQVSMPTNLHEIFFFGQNCLAFTTTDWTDFNINV